MRASSFLNLPEKLKKSNYILNIKNLADEECAKWCILAHLFPKYTEQQKRSTDVNVYKQHEKDLVTTGVQFPLRIEDASKLENLNGLNINIYSIDKTLFQKKKEGECRIKYYTIFYRGCLKIIYILFT